jgi:hypothetical protein
MSPETAEICQVAGAVLILVGFAGQQLGWLDCESFTYLIFNTIGGGTLAIVASMGSDWGFLLLEGSWAVISFVSLAKRPFHNVDRELNNVSRELRNVDRELHNISRDMGGARRHVGAHRLVVRSSPTHSPASAGVWLS